MALCNDCLVESYKDARVSSLAMILSFATVCWGEVGSHSKAKHISSVVSTEGTRLVGTGLVQGLFSLKGKAAPEWDWLGDQTLTRTPTDVIFDPVSVQHMFTTTCSPHAQLDNCSTE
jgi:hypothetical protein